MPAKRKTLQDEVAEVMGAGAETPVAPGGTRVVTDADLEADREFVASLDEKGDALGAAEADVPKPEATDEPEPAQGVAVDAPPAAVADAAPARGGVNALVTCLLADPALSYEAIVAAVRAEHPGAQTTARSVASTASVLRRKGTPVPMRRGPKA